MESIKDLRTIDPLGYLDFLNLSSGARLVLTDSGGIQEETTALGIPCLTLAREYRASNHSRDGNECRRRH